MRKYHSHLVLSLVAFALFIGLAAAAGAEEPTKGVPVENFADDYTNHFKCYSVNSDFDKRFDVFLVDQFKESQGITYRPVMLCNPVSKNGEPILYPDVHLVCYIIIQEQPDPVRRVLISNQFHDINMEVKDGRLLCVPSKKTELQ